MEQQKTLNLLNEASDPKFVTGKRNIVHDQSNANYDIRNEIRKKGYISLGDQQTYYLQVFQSLYEPQEEY